MAHFSFAEWYARMGYHRHGGQKACAEALAITSRHIRMLLAGQRQPSQTLIALCKAVQSLHARPTKG